MGLGIILFLLRFLHNWACADTRVPVQHSWEDRCSGSSRRIIGERERHGRTRIVVPGGVVGIHRKGWIDRVVRDVGDAVLLVVLFQLFQEFPLLLYKPRGLGCLRTFLLQFIQTTRGIGQFHHDLLWI